ncbi:hypothetical protein [Occultella gossypii]|uniref:Helix-turn-helix domain-containing protein n=1 Tax=Occultella gossypii TaxID=2800820 RepID=A0ABS7SA66_9MICO|nr:hypothetical protein [Occultella gossypii]MBZ2197241.1 hypothetical protein [Occultella gossypii]
MSSFTFQPGAFSREMAAAYLAGASVRKVDEWEKKGLLVGLALDGRRVYTREELDRFIASRPEWANRNDDA